MKNINHVFGFKIKQIDTHVKGTLTECQLDRYGKILDKKVLKDYIVFPKEIFLYWCIKNVIAKGAIERKSNFSHFEEYFETLINPTYLKIGGLYKSRVLEYERLYELIIAVFAIDDKLARVDISTVGSWNYSFGKFTIAKPLLESMIKRLKVNVIFPTIWTDVEYAFNKIKPKINSSKLMRPFKLSIINAMDVILNSPVNTLFSNSFKMLIPNIEGILKAYILHKGITNISTNSLGTISKSISKYRGSEFSNEFKDYLKIILHPMRNLSLHGGLPSESVCKFLVIIVFELLEEILNNE